MEITHKDQPNSRKTIGVIGAGISGLLACKYALQKGFLPTVFEAHDSIGGVWSSNVITTTKLQTPKYQFQFSDFPWPDSVAEEFPHHRQVMDYLTRYALHFKLLPHIKFNHKVIGIDYVSSSSEEEDQQFLWGGSGHAFSDRGKWNVTVQDNSVNPNPSHHQHSHQEYIFDFVMVCIGKYSDVANIPQFPMNKGPEVFQGKVLHSMDYAALLTDNNAAASPHDLVQDKRVTVIGFQKSALDIASQISQLNGTKNPCTLVFRRAHWSVSEDVVVQSFKNLNRFSELMVHKPNQGFFLWLLALLLSPMLWIYSKITERYLKRKYPMAKYNTIPEHPYLNQIRTCTLAVLPPNFYDKVSEGSIILKKSHSFHFCDKGIVVTSVNRQEGEKEAEEENVEIVEADVVIFATGYASQHKLASIFKSTDFQKCISGLSAPLYRYYNIPSIQH
ncbi:OLC1v1018416C2 [Oldenlandia corymbosa var. corymbosa]|uniref:Flavin-containing monooxygenase n=1 Tax=Oldenlandia corymbosa var. corymbosa TaxID=529605 RepID=A0AAV1EBK5_OLDCO|nr:OLC1v1018416C2 [Oldenlandia corymbosa var. corymbosa]